MLLFGDQRWKWLATIFRPLPFPLNKSRFHFLDQKFENWNKIENLKRMKIQFFDFLVYEIWSFKILRIFWIFFFRPKRCAMFWNRFFGLWVFFLVFEIWLILNKTFVVHWVLEEIRHFFMLGVLRPQALNTFGLNPTIELVIGFHWLPFLNQVRKKI